MADTLLSPLHTAGWGRSRFIVVCETEFILISFLIVFLSI